MPGLQLQPFQGWAPSSGAEGRLRAEIRAQLCAVLLGLLCVEALAQVIFPRFQHGWGGWEGDPVPSGSSTVHAGCSILPFPALPPSSLASRCFGDEKCGKFTPVLLDFVDFGYSFGRLNGQSQLLESEEYTAQGLCQQPQTGTGNMGSQLCIPMALASFQLHSMSRWSNNRSPALSFQAPGAGQGAGQSRGRCCVPFLLPTSDSLSFPLLYGQHRLPGGFP